FYRATGAILSPPSFPPRRSSDLAGPVPVAMSLLGPRVPSPLPSSTETVLVPWLATARSIFPSPLKSPLATELGFDATLNIRNARSEEHTSELQSRGLLVCSLLLE